MRKIFVVIVLCMLSVSFMEAELKRFEVTPLFSFDYLMAGDSNVPLSFRIDNRSNLSLENVYARIVLSFPFSPSTLARKELRSDIYKLDNIESYTSKNALFKIDVSKSAKYGDYLLQIVVSYDDPQDPMYHIEETFLFNIHVTGETLVEVSDLVVGKDGAAYVGDDFDVGFHVDNKGENRLQWLKVSLVVEDESIVLSEGSLKIFENVPGRSRQNVSYHLSIDSNAQPKNYILKMIVEYKDERKELGREEITSGIKVSGTPKLAIGGKGIDPAVITAEKDFTLTLKIDNTGSEIAEGVKVSLDTQFAGDKEAYLGKIERDDYANAIFILRAGVVGEYDIKVKINYEFTGSSGASERQEMIHVVVRPQEQLNYIPFIGAAVGLVILFIAARTLRKK
jgi:hypothetical protein